jgi:predicted nucleic acid-binding protein
MRVYWDSCVFISLFDGGRGRTPEQLDGLNAWALLLDEGEIEVCTSALTLAEVLELKDGDNLSPEQYADYERFINSGVVELLSLELGVVRKTKEIREHALNNQIKPKLLIPDAIHLATAAVHGCSEFHTFDGAAADGSAGKLLALDGKLAGVQGMPKICIPQRIAMRTRRGTPIIGGEQGDLLGLL